GCSVLTAQKYYQQSVTVDANTGKIYSGVIKLQKTTQDQELSKLLALVSQNLRTTVTANADNAVDAKKAKQYGAKGIGLCRTEHMFIGDDEVAMIREILFAENPSDQTFTKLREIQTQDFYELFKEVAG